MAAVPKPDQIDAPFEEAGPAPAPTGPSPAPAAPPLPAEPAAAGAKAPPPPPPPKPPKCPECKKGAPAWMATFADMATLLMAFFVLILSFAEMNVPKYKQISGSLKMAFGVQRIVPTVEPPKAQSLIAQHFSPAVAQPTPVNTVRQQTTDETQPEVERKTDTRSADFENNADYRVLQEALQKEIAKGQVELKVEGEKLVVQMKGPTAGPGRADGRQDDSRKQTGGMSASEDKQMQASIAEAKERMTSQVEVRAAAAAPEGKSAAGRTPAGSRPNDAESVDERFERIKAELSEDVARGLAEIERDGDRIIVRLGEQGGFVSGRAELQPGFLPLLDRVGAAISRGGGRVTVEGHTDNVPIAFSERFRSNWDLSAARAASVADYLLTGTPVQPGRVKVAGFADTRPIDSNETAAGRSRNRRIEVVLD